MRKNLAKYFLLFFSCAILYAQPEIPKFSSYAIDYTKTLSDDQINYLNGALKTFDDSTSNQIVFFMNKTLDGFPIEMFTYETAQANKIGTKENSNGVLFYVAKEDRKMRIEVGYGLEGTLPDALASSIIRNDVAPFFKRDQYYEGTLVGLNSIIAATRGEYKGNPNSDKETKIPIGLIIFIMIMIFMMSRNKGKGGRGGGFIYYGGGLGGRSGGFGGSSGGGFGGFSGGGGSFGGGGASGSW